MAADTLDLEIVTPEGRKLSESVKEVTAPGALGELGVLPGHIPILTVLDIGALTFVPSKGGGARVLAVGGGYLEVDRDRLVVITESAEFKEDIDAERARKALDDATKKLDGLDSGDASFAPTYDLLAKRRKRAEVRLQVASS